MSEQRIYTGLFLFDPYIDQSDSMVAALSRYHVTYDHFPGDPRFPQDVAENDWAYIEELGVYDDGEVCASLVWIKKHSEETYLRVQYDRTNYAGRPLRLPLHITWQTAEGIKPVEAGKRLYDMLHNDTNLEYYMPLNRMRNKIDGDVNILRNMMEANDLDYNSSNDYNVYAMRMKEIGSMMKPMGVWKTFTSNHNVTSDEEE